MALEALGYAIAKRANPDKKVTGSYEVTLARIFDALGYEPAAVVGESGTGSAWWRRSTRHTRGVKHADNPLTEARDDWPRGKEGIMHRPMLARQLGVPEGLVTKTSP